MPFPIRLAFIHPLWLMTLAIIALAAPVLIMNSNTVFTVSTDLMLACALLLSLGWAHGIYRGARLVLAQSSTATGSRDWVFYTAEIGVSCIPVLALGSSAVKGSEGVLGFIVFPLVLSYFASLWLASTALVASEEGTLRIALGKVVGTFLLMVYWMIGAWVIQRRLKALRITLETSARPTVSPVP